MIIFLLVVIVGLLLLIILGLASNENQKANELEIARLKILEQEQLRQRD